MKPLVIYHADCTDGFGAAFAAWLKLGDEAEYLPMQYGFKPHEMPSFTDRTVYMVDFSWPRDLMTELFEKAESVVWLDHHKTAFEMWCETERELYKEFNNLDRSILLDNNKSGALLAWEYFHPNTEVPMLIQHIDDRDRWQFQLEGSKELHAALASMKPWSFEQWENILDLRDPVAVEQMIDEGWAILRAQKQHVTSMAKQARKCEIWKLTDDNYEVEYQFKLPGLALNTPSHMSEVGHELANASGTFGLVYYIGSDNKVKCSLRSNGEYDVSAIAKSFGGGGHRNAAGFETDIETLMGWLK